ncbi:Fic/DOC family protein [Leucobacter musarum]|uniref:Fic/DOC family protein n=1 Tax=Leucobacter musarum TaxID=1930747 RepID=UPI0006A760A0|nr:Fic family protein [Leucobacter musarum]
MASPEFVDPYLDPATGFLKHLTSARTAAELAQAEGALTFTCLMELGDHPSAPTSDLAEFQAIHRHLFQDVYAWAGKLRTVDLWKDADGEPFVPSSLIERAADFAAGELQSEGSLRGPEHEAFVSRLAFHYDQFNHIHPFREGNGRTQRVFWERIANDAGWQLDWRSVQGSTNDEARRIAAERRDFAPLESMFRGIVSPFATDAGAADGKQAEQLARLAFPVAAARMFDEDRTESSTASPRSASSMAVIRTKGASSDE